MKKQFPVLMLIFSLSTIVPASSPDVRAQAEPFYKGKTIRIMVGSTAGGFTTAGPASLPDTWGSIFPVNRKSSLRTCPAPDL